MAKVKENELIERVVKCLEDVSPEDFLECCNEILGTNYSEEDVEWTP